MFDLKDLTDNLDRYCAGWMRRNSQAFSQVKESLEADLKKRKELIRSHEDLLAARNKASQEIAQKKKAGADASAEILAQKDVGEKIKASDVALTAFQADFETKILHLPNIPDGSVPD